jgi:hypothetical protein
MNFECTFPSDFPFDVLVILLIQVEKGTTSKLLLQVCLDFISQQRRFAIYMSPISTYQIFDKRDRRYDGKPYGGGKWMIP